MDLSILFKLFCCCILLVKADVCVQRSPCSCVFPNGTGIDLAPSANNGVLTSLKYTKIAVYNYSSIRHYHSRIGNTWKYFFHPCSDVPMPKLEVDVDSCIGDWSICRLYQNFTRPAPSSYIEGPKHFEPVGTVRYSHFSSDGTYISYSWPLSTHVYLTCSEHQDSLSVKAYNPVLMELRFFSRNACLRQLESPVSEQSELTVLRWMDMQWTQVSQAAKDGYAYVVDGLKWLVRQPLERMPSLRI